MGLVTSLIAPVASGFLPEWRLPLASSLDVLDGWVPIQAVTEVRPSDSAPLVAETPAMNKTPDARVRSTTPVFFWIWLGGATCAGVVLLGGISRVMTLLYRSKPLADAECNAVAKEISSTLGIKRRVRLLENDRAVLGAWGVLKPRIFLPRDVGDWPNERIRAVLTHEMAHIKRFDWPVQMLAEVARAVYWFNPAFWLVLSFAETRKRTCM